MKVFVTGSTGAIGQWVVRRLLEAGHELVAMDLRAHSTREYLYIPGDIRDLPGIRRAIQGCEAVVHLAAIPFDMERQDELILDTNLRGTWNILLAAEEAGVRRVVHVSSINALGQGEKEHPALYLPLDDDIPHFNVHNYSLTKHLGEEMCQSFARRGGFTSVSLRPSLVTFPGPNHFRWWDFIPEAMRIETNNKDFWSYTDVRDVAEACLLSLTASIQGHQSFLITADDNRAHLPTREIVETHYPHLPWPKINKEEYLARGEFTSLVDCSAAKKVLGWQPKYSRFDPAAGY